MSDANHEQASNNHAQQSNHDPPLLEWLAGVVGLILVVALVSFLIYEALSGSDEPPNMEVEVMSITPLNNQYLVQFKINNTGGETGAGVVVEGVLHSDGEIIETSSVTIAYVPPHSAREGGLYFTQNPAQYTLQVRAIGYELP